MAMGGGLLTRWSADQPRPQNQGGLLTRWSADQTRGIGYGRPDAAPVPASAPSGGGMLSNWSAKQPRISSPPELKPGQVTPAMLPLPQDLPAARAAPLMASGALPSPGNPAYWANPKLPVAAPSPQHMLELMQQEARRTEAERRQQALVNQPPWATHVDPRASLGHNLAAPALWGLQAFGEPFLAVPRALRGLKVEVAPGVSMTMDQMLEGAGHRYKQAEGFLKQAAAADPMLARAAPQTWGGFMPINETPELLAMKQREEFLNSHSPEALAALAPPAMAGKFPTGGSAVYGERARQIAEQAGAPQARANERLQSELYSDPRASETMVQQFLREKLPLVGPAFDPQTQTIGEKLGETSGNPLLGSGLDLVAGIGPLAALGKVRGLAGTLARGVSMPEGRLGRVLGAEVNPLVHADNLIQRGYEAGGGLLNRYLAARQERLPDAQAPTQTLPAQATGLPAVRAERPTMGASPPPAPEPLRARANPESPPAPPDRMAAPAVTPEPARPPSLDYIQAKLAEAKGEFNSLNTASIGGELDEAQKARMIFLRSTLPQLQKQLKRATKAAENGDVQYSGSAPDLAWRLHQLVHESSPEQVQQFANRFQELRSTGSRAQAARSQAVQEALRQMPERAAAAPSVGVEQAVLEREVAEARKMLQDYPNAPPGLAARLQARLGEAEARLAQAAPSAVPAARAAEPAPGLLDAWDRGIGDLQANLQEEAARAARGRLNAEVVRANELSRAWKQAVPAFGERPTPDQLAKFGARVGELTPRVGERAARRMAVQEMFEARGDVQYSGQAPQFNQAPTGPRGAQPAPAPAPAVAPAQPVPAAPVVAPGRNLAGEVKSVPHINRDIRETLGMVSRGETKDPGLLTRWARRLSQPSDTRISYGDGTLPAGTGGAYHGKRDLIEVRRPADGETTYHEMGHQIARHSGLIDQAPSRAMADLEKLGDPATPGVPAAKSGARSSWSPSMTGARGQAYKRGEGFAEFLRVWMTHPDEAERLAPAMSQHWESWLDSQGAVGKRMRQHQADVQARADADFGKRMDAQIVSETRRRQLEAKSSRDDLTTRFFDRFHPLRKLRDLAAQAKEVLPTDDFYRGATMLASKVKNETNREVEELRSIFEAVRSARNPRQAEDDLRRYLYARRADELHNRGMRSGFEKADVTEALRRLNTPTHEDIARRLYEFQDRQLELLHDSGMLSTEALEKIRAENKNYIPMQRHFELGAGELSNERNTIAGASLRASNPIKAIRGSERDILDPLVGVIANTYRNRLAAAKNNVLRSMLKLWDEHGEKVGHAIKGRVSVPLGFTPAHVAELLKEPKLRSALEDLGVDVSAVTPVELETLIEMLPEGSIARPNQALLDQGHIVPVRENGKTAYMQLSPEMHRAVTGIGSEFTTDPWTWLNMGAGNILRAGATSLNWKFALRNAMRDSLVLPLVSRVGGGTNLPFFPFVDGLVTKLKAAREDPNALATVKRWEGSGGKQDFEAQYADRSGAEDALRAHQGVLPSRDPAGVAAVRSLAGRAKRALGSLSEISEDSTRLGHYKAAEAYFKRKFPHWSPENVHLAAAFEARDTLDFSRRGSAPAVRWLRANIPFLGAGMEGTRRQLEALRENPARYLGAGAVYMSAPTVLNQTGVPGLYRGNWNNADYNQLRQSTKDNDMVVRNPAWDGIDPNMEFLKLPHEKGPSALFSQLPEWAMQAMKGDQAPTETRVRQMASAIAGDFLPAGVDPLHPSTWLNTLGEGVSLPVEEIANYDSYRDKPIIPDFLKRQHPDPGQQYDDRSSVLARLLGSKLGISPLMIDHALYGTTAGLGQTALNHLVDPVLSAATGVPEAPSRTYQGPGQLGLEMSGTQVFPGQPESMARFDARLLELQQKKDRFQAHPTSKREAMDRRKLMSPMELEELRKMEMSDKQIKRWQSALKAPQIRPEKREQLMESIRRETSKYTPAPGGRP